MHRSSALLTAACLLVLAPACSADGGGKGKNGGQHDDDYPACGNPDATHFLVNQLTIGIDPLDYAGESWDWDGGGIAEFWDEYDTYIELALVLASEGTYQMGSLDDVVALMDIAAPILLSPYVSPDLDIQWTWWDGVNEFDDGTDQNPEDTNLVDYTSLEMGFPDDESAWFLDFYDRDLTVDDYAGWTFLDLWLLQEAADCGPVVMVLDDYTMSDWDTRVRFVVLDVESW